MSYFPINSENTRRDFSFIFSLSFMFKKQSQSGNEGLVKIYRITGSGLFIGMGAGLFYAVKQRGGGERCLLKKFKGVKIFWP